MALFTTLYSGSSGNCALILSRGKGNLLIDMGKKLPYNLECAPQPGACCIRL